ncbi:class I lanthipeptide [Flavobacterium sp.]|uniref:class I lanthipeptide n=1 Tax=Flavobacterium sp. TaxID=239 RepID=UPI0031D93B39
MKNQNPKNKLVFNKAAVTELNDNLLAVINGGTSIIGGEDTCTGCCCLRVTFDLM